MGALDKAKQRLRWDIFKKYNGRCAYCGCEIDFYNFHIDHITPKRRGDSISYCEKYGIEKGKDCIDNYNPSCASCNLSKSVFTLEVWRSEIFKKIERLSKYNTSFNLLHRFGVIKIVNKPVVFYFEKNNK